MRPYSVRGSPATLRFTLSATVSFMPVWENACFRMSITSSSVSTSGLIRKLSSIAPLVQSRCVRSFRVVCLLLSNVCVVTSFYQSLQAMSPFMRFSICASYFTLSFVGGQCASWRLPPKAAMSAYGHHSFVEGIKNGGLDLFKAAAAINKHG